MTRLQRNTTIYFCAACVLLALYFFYQKHLDWNDPCGRWIDNKLEGRGWPELEHLDQQLLDQLLNRPAESDAQRALWAQWEIAVSRGQPELADRYLQEWTNEADRHADAYLALLGKFEADCRKVYPDRYKN